MKKKMRLILLLLVCFTGSCAYTEKKAEVKDGIFPGLDAETERRIIQDFFDTYVKPGDPKATVNDIWVAGYYGTYNGVIAVRFGDFFEHADVETEESVAGINFTYPNPKPNYAWKDGILYRLREAYDLGLLTDDDVKNIHRMYYSELTDDEYADFIK
jgi:hypothetical protein